MKLCKHLENKFEEMENLLRLCRAFYLLPDCSAGGPLHILLDDYNYDRHSIEFCIEECKKNPESMSSRLGLLICDELLRLSLEERCVFFACWTGETLGCYSHESCETCKYFDEFYEYAKEEEKEE